jgi:hypothetical protein
LSQDGRQLPLLPTRSRSANLVAEVDTQIARESPLIFGKAP